MDALAGIAAAGNPDKETVVEVGEPFNREDDACRLACSGCVELVRTRPFGECGLLGNACPVEELEAGGEIDAKRCRPLAAALSFAGRATVRPLSAACAFGFDIGAKRAICRKVSAQT